MKTYKISVNLLTDTLIGSAEGYGAIIDSDVIFDDAGIPYIPAKRFKGILRESAEILENLFKGIGKNFDLKIDEILGEVGMTDKESAVNIPDLFIPQYLENFAYVKYLQNLKDELAGFYISKDMVMSYFTEVRINTKVNSKFGVSERGSLRTLRLINKGLTFENNINIDEKYENIFALICKATKKIGSKRNRGLGKIGIILYDDKNKEIQPSLTNDVNR